MPHPTFQRPDLTTLTGLNALELNATGQHLSNQRAVIECHVIDPDEYYHR